MGRSATGDKTVHYRKGNDSGTESHRSRDRFAATKSPQIDQATIQRNLDQSKDGFTLRGHLDSLETVIVDIVSELKYHRHQTGIIAAEKDTSAAVAEMNIVQAKNAVLNSEFRLE